MPDSNRPADLSTFRLRRRTPGSFLLVPCPKQGRSIRCQGQLEAAAAVILVACPQVAPHPRATLGDLVRVAGRGGSFRDPTPRRPSRLASPAA